MKSQNKLFVILLALIIIVFFVVFQYTIFLKKQNDLLIANVDDIKEQIISFESRNNSERWSARLAALTKENNELKNKIAVLEAVLAQETAKSGSSKPKETPAAGNKGFLLKKR
ncbi:MAG: hypothetical protein ABH882_04495 [Candidatus Omnitrophota bacterium]|nr:hypothetical protein [Candidatus Omnitrophota bacterium]MBU2035529.1 hypothetical protein [Candidatus Omnitrophota bacterium]MBU2222050.1 hypothetical protein [Candidatus Omnitrophota bacterium]MBU2258376.1 hypothetical protein [Candidatus Omnitrophota bacterium]